MSPECGLLPAATGALDAEPAGLCSFGVVLAHGVAGFHGASARSIGEPGHLPDANGDEAPAERFLAAVGTAGRHRRFGSEFLREAGPNREPTRLVAQALAGPALQGGELAGVSPTSETAALRRLTASWHSVIDNVFIPSE